MFGINFSILWIFAGFVHLDEATLIDQQFEHVSQFIGLVDSTNIITTTSSYTILSCSKTCAKYPNCEGFYYTPATKECQLQSARTTQNQFINDMLIAKASSRYYQLPLNLPSTSPFVCPSQNGGWVTAQLPDRTFAQYYLDNSVSLNQTDSLAYCRARGANLMKIVTAQKMNWYLNNIIPCSDVNGWQFYIAGKNTPTNPDHVTYDGDVVPLIPGIWADERPNGLVDQNCLQSRLLSFNYMIDDIQCFHADHQIICEKILM